MLSRVYSLLKRVPKGKVTTYKELGRASGLHPRTIGMLMRRNKDPAKIPCYRVVCSDGTVGGYSAEGGVKTKVKLLQRDGIEIRKGKINLKKHLFKF